jgi:hypothetical protein
MSTKHDHPAADGREHEVPGDRLLADARDMPAEASALVMASVEAWRSMDADTYASLADQL